MTDDRNLPDVWGAGQLLAFSGLDGPTDWHEPFVLHTAASPGSLTVLLPVQVDVTVDGLEDFVAQMILGDCLTARTSRGPWVTAFSDDHTLVGVLPAGASICVAGHTIGGSPMLCAEAGGLGLFAQRRSSAWVLLVGPAGAAAAIAGRCAAALTVDIDGVISARSRFVRGSTVPSGLNDERVRLYRKALAVLKVNCHSAYGTIRRRWSTPDRWPHQHMWLWDSAFHGVGMSYVDLGVAQDLVLAMLEQVRGDGMLPHMVRPDGQLSRVTQPPVLGWAAWHILERGGDPQWASECKPFLFRYLEWMRMHRDRNGNDVPEWYIEGNPLCRCGESGLDNSPVYDRGVLLDAADFGSFLSNDYGCLAALASRLGDDEMSGACRAHAERIGRAVSSLLWCDGTRCFYHRGLDGNFVPVKAVSGFMPLFAGIATPIQAEALRRELQNPSTFGAPLPVPSVSLDSGTYCKDMWRGPTWMNLSYLVWRGLRKYGFTREAAVLREQLVNAVGDWYERDGCLWEYYDSLGVTSPRHLDRKQRLITGNGIAPISDYHWTAAVTVALLAAE